jgi:hypothetical protein
MQIFVGAYVTFVTIPRPTWKHGHAILHALKILLACLVVWTDNVTPGNGNTVPGNGQGLITENPASHAPPGQN